MIVEKMSEIKKPIFISQQVSNHGTNNPIVARLGLQIIDLCNFFELSTKQKDDLFDILHDKVCKRCLECFDIYKDFETYLLNIRSELDKKGLEYQSEGKVLNLPSMPDVQGKAERFLYVSKLLLRDLTAIFNVFFDKNFSNENSLYEKVIQWANEKFGTKDPVCVQIKKDYDSWIKELIAKRNAIEHPGGHSGVLHIADYSFVCIDGTNKICEPIWYRNSDSPTYILFDMEIYVHNCFTFAEAVFVLCLQKMTPIANMPFKIVEIAEQERDASNPVRFRVVL